MALLVFNVPDGVQRYQLKPGSNTIGRIEGNDQVVPDASVSSRHCEVVLNGTNLLLRDLGSTNGTYVNEQKVEQAILNPGEKFRLGNVEVTFVERVQEPLPAPEIPKTSISLVPSPPPSGAAPLRVGGAKLSVSSHAVAPQVPLEQLPMGETTYVEGECQHHPGSRAVGTCMQCTKHLCSHCIRKEKVGAKTFDFCLHCGGKCVSYGQPIAPVVKARRTFKEMLVASFSYPFKGNGLILLVTGTLFFSFLDFITSTRAIMIVSAPVIFVKIMSIGYLFAYMQKIVNATAEGEDEPPGWPDVSEIYQDIFQPFLLLLATVIVSFLPAILVMTYAPLAGNLLLLFGVFFFPMALLAVCMSDSISGLNPIFVLSAILKAPGAYTVACIFMAGLVIMQRFVPDNIPDIPVLKPLIISGVSLYLLTVEMRILGALYHTKKDKLGWF